MNDIKITGALSNYILSQTLSYFNCILDKSTLVVSFSLLPAVFKSKVTSTSPFSSELSFNLMPLVSEGMSRLSSYRRQHQDYDVPSGHHSRYSGVPNGRIHLRHTKYHLLADAPG
jgi:hypothetical protein